MGRASRGRSLTDRFGVRKVMSLGQIATGVLLLLMSMAGSALQAGAVMLAAGVARSSVFPGTTKAIMDWFPPASRATAMGIKQTGVPIAGMAVAAILPTLGLAIGWRSVAGGFLSLWNVGGIFGRVSWGLISDRVFHGRRLVVLAIIGALSALATLAVGRIEPGYPLWLLTAIVLAAGATIVSWNGVYHALVAENSRPQVRGHGHRVHHDHD